MQGVEHHITGAAAFIFGTIVGSFLNVCIYRMPRKESVVTPRSHCTSCGKTIAWFDNIPLLSQIFLLGKCRHCKARISFIYFTVELLTGALFLGFLMHFGLSVKYAVFTALGSALIVISFIDLKIQEIPDEISLPGMATGLILCFIFPEIISAPTRPSGLVNSALGLLAGGLLIYAMGAIGEAIFKKEAMGGGDVKLMAMIGAFIGWKAIILAFFLAPFFGSAVGIVAKIKNKEDVIPYGPHLSLAGIAALLWGDKILSFIIPY
jgi:leader peptidase (prepilin peptidase)/N-methyltransferase